MTTKGDTNMLMKMTRTGGISPIDELVMDPEESYDEFKTKMVTFFYATYPNISKEQMTDIYGIVNRARKHQISMRFDVIYDDVDYNDPLDIAGESIQIYHYECPMGFVLFQLLNCRDSHQADRLLKNKLDTVRKLDEIITLFGLQPIESDTMESKRRRIVSHTVSDAGPKVWFTDFVKRVYGVKEYTYECDSCGTAPESIFSIDAAKEIAQDHANLCGNPVRVLERFKSVMDRTKYIDIVKPNKEAK